MLRYIFSVLIVGLCNLSYLSAQKTSFSLGVGSTYYMGDMQQTFPDMRPGLVFHYNINLYKNLSLRLGVLHGQYGADDANSEQNKSRGLRFNSPLSEGSMQLLWEFLPQRLGANGRDWTSKHRFSPYIFAGIGGAFINPRVENETGWTSLQPLGTEGQFIMRGNTHPKPYKLFQMVVPGGLGVKYRFSRNFGVGIDIGYRYTFTDYLDDVSGVYANKEDIRAFSGKDADFFSDPTRIHAAGTARGNPNNKDSYVFGSFSITYFLLKAVCPQP